MANQWDGIIELSTENTIVPAAFNVRDGNVTGLVGPDGENAAFRQGNETGYQYISLLLPLNQAGGPSVLPTDYSKDGVECSFGASATVPWGNAGYFTSVASAENKALVVPNSAVALNLSTDSFLFGFTLNKAAPAGTETILGCTNNSSQPGFMLNIQLTSGYLGLRLFANGATLETTYGTTAAASGADKRIMIAWDAVAKTFTSYIDGVQDLQQTATTVLSTDIIATDLSLGRTTVGNTVAAKFAGVMFAKFAASSLPKNLDELVLADVTFHRSSISGMPVFL